MRYTISFLLTSLSLAPAWAEVPRVMTDIPPVHSLVAQVMGDLGQPGLLVSQGANAHSFQLRPSQAAGLADAGLVVWVGPEMTPWLDRALEGISPDIPRLTLLAAEGTGVIEYGSDHGEGEGHDHAADEAHSHDHAATESEPRGEGEDHAHTGTDPHAWLDPHNARVWLDLIAADLSRLDPANAATYAANAGAAKAGLEALEAELTATLAPVRDKPFVVFHDAYGYFTAHFGLTPAGKIAPGDAAAPGAARLAALRAGMEAGSALCIFPEAAHDPKLIEQMADGTQVRIGGILDPEGTSLDPGPGLYAALMRSLATTMAECLSQTG